MFFRQLAPTEAGRIVKVFCRGAFEDSHPRRWLVALAMKEEKNNFGRTALQYMGGGAEVQSAGGPSCARGDSGASRDLPPEHMTQELEHHDASVWMTQRRYE